MVGYFEDLDEAQALAGTMLGLASFLAASDEDQTKALDAATQRIDVAMNYQGRKFDPSQALEFPRIAYGSGAVQPPSSFILPPIAPDTIWDWDASANDGQGAAIVPDRVKRACLIEADSLLAGTRAERLDALHDGMTGQQIGSASEQYSAGSGQQAAGSLCRAAHELMAKYRLRSGEMV